VPFSQDSGTLKGVSVLILKPLSFRLLPLVPLCLAIFAVPVPASGSSASGEPPDVRAVPVDTAPRIDGFLDEEVWETAPAARDFIQKQPAEGRPASEDTEVRVLYTRTDLFIGVMCFDSQPERIIANIKRRDSEDILQNDHIRILLDTFRDRRNGYIFVTNPLGARYDLQVRKEGKQEGSTRIANPNLNTDWDAVWEVKARILKNGWSAEIAIPLHCLRYHTRSSEGWGLNILRNIRRKNEESTWAPLPRNLEFYKVSLAGTLQGLDKMEKSLNLQVKPYVLGDATAERAAGGPLEVKGHLDAGLDLKYGLTSDLTAELTVNTDFSQVEADEQQINLTRFSLYYPEKREFFLENAAVFSVGTPEDAMIFFSRRIGLSGAGEEIPLLGGIKVAGKAGRFNLGIINLQSRSVDDIPANNFTVLRLSRDVLGQSAVGLMVTNRQSSESGNWNRAFSLDGDFVFGENFSLSGYCAVTATPGLEGENRAVKLGFNWLSDLWDIYGYCFDIQNNFNAEMGFVKRTGIRRGQIHIGFTPEPDFPGIRRLNPHIFVAYTDDRHGTLLMREWHAHLNVELINGGSFGIQANRFREFVDVPFEIQTDVIVPVAVYDESDWKIDFKTDKSRNLSFEAGYKQGGFYGGKSRILELCCGFRPLPNLTGEVDLVYNDIDLPQGAFVNHLLLTRLVYTFTTRLYLMSLVQWNSETDSVDVNLRLNFIYRPGSSLYLVYNENRWVKGMPYGVEGRSLALKMNYLFNF
jgi:hypothetical protein